MDNDQIWQQFEDIEGKVDKIIAVCKQHEATNLELSNKIERLEEELQARIEAENGHREDKALIRSKIDGLLSKLEDISEEE
ncbi:MAG: DUF904 domain-containing protein [Desulfobacterales bacterium]|nr:DUF904 domain-containing protein [Desulfobacterales bacterium]